MDEHVIRPPVGGKSINALALNCAVPGLGSLYRGDAARGAGQLALLISGVILTPVLVGLPLVAAAWVWSIHSGLRDFREAHR